MKNKGGKDGEGNTEGKEERERRKTKKGKLKAIVKINGEKENGK